MDAALPVDRRRTGRDGLWLSLSALAVEKRVSKQAISKNLKRWEELGKPVASRREGRELLVNVAEYDERRGELVDLAKETGEATKKADAGRLGGDPTYTREQARKMAYDADLAQLKLQERLGQFVPVSALEQAAVDCGEALVRIIDQVTTRAEEVAAAVVEDGVVGARAVLKTIVRELRQRAADEFSKLPALHAAPTELDDGEGDE